MQARLAGRNGLRMGVSPCSSWSPDRSDAQSGRRGHGRRMGDVVGAVDAAGSVEVHESPLVVAERSPADILRLGVAAASLAIVLLVQWLAGDVVVENTHDLLRGLDTVPSWLVTLVVTVTWLAGMLAFVGGALVGLAHGRWRALGSAVVGGALGLLIAALVGLAHAPSAPALAPRSEALDFFIDNPTATKLLVAIPDGVATAAAP